MATYSATWRDPIPRAVSSTGNTRLRFSITPTSWVVTQVGILLDWGGGEHTTVVIDGTESDYGYVMPRGAGEYLMVIKGAAVFESATTLPAAVTITADVVVQDPSDTSESGTAALTASTTVYAPPTVSITSPAEGATVNALPLVITWDVTDATGITGQHIQFYGLDDYFPDPAAREYTVPSDLIENDTSYFVEIVEYNGVGLSSRDGVNFSTHWAPPATPTARLNTIPTDLSVSITVFEGYVDGNEPATASLMVTRVTADGTRWVVASGLRSGETCIDPLPPLGADYSYAITAVTEAGTTSVATVGNRLGGCAWALNLGQRAAVCHLLGRNPSDRGGVEHGGELFHFADGGQAGGLPVFYPTTDRDRHGTLEVTAESRGQLFEVVRDVLAEPVCWLRDPFGRRWRAHVTAEWNVSRSERRLTLSWDEVRWGEAW